MNEQTLSVYSIGPPTGSGRRLHLNEFRFAHEPGVINAVRRAGSETSPTTLLAEYPTGPPAELLEELARFVGVAGAANITIAAGSDEALRAMIETCGIRNQKIVVVGVPTYTHFTHFARLRGLRLCEYALGLETSAEGHVSLLECYADELQEGALVYLGNPNNPTGNLWDPTTVADFAARFPRSTFLVDEAYTEFAGIAASKGAEPQASKITPRMAFNARSLAPLAAATPNIVVTRTFSKAFGLAALRVGYAVGVPSMIEQLNLVLSPKAVSLIAGVAALAVLGALPHYYGATWAALAATCSLIDQLRELGWWVLPAAADVCANFFLVYVHDADWVVTQLERSGIYIRNRTGLPGLAGFVRVSAGSVEDCDAVLRAFRKLTPPTKPAIQCFFAPKEKIAALRKLLRRTLKVLRGLSIVPWLSAGSLLGAVRHGGIIPWDDDIDLGYVPDTRLLMDPLATNAESFRAAGLTLQRNRTDAYWQVGTNEPGATISATHIDVFPFLEKTSPDGGREYVVADERYRDEAPDCPDAHCNIRFSHKELFPLREVFFYNEHLHIPHQAEDILLRALGQDYKTIARVRLGAGHVNGDAVNTATYTIQDYFPA